MFRITRNNLLTAACLAGAAGIGAFAMSAPGEAQSSAAQDRGATIYTAELRALPNTSGQGTATLRLSANEKNLNIHITASGLEPGGPHVSHIHGRPGGAESDCPTIAQDSDGDGFVELAEGQVTYGPIIIDFMNIDPDQDGNIDFRKTVQLTGANADALPLENRHIVIHGKSTPQGVGAGTPGEVNGSPGFKAVLPVLCGEIVQQARGRDPMEFKSPKG